MTNNEILKADLLDIIFEHRNKSYGAYALRRYYNNRLLIALGIALSVVFLFFLISLLIGNNRQNSSYKPDDTGGIKLTELNIEKLKNPELILPKKATPVAQVKYVIPIIVPDEQAEVIPDVKDISEYAISTINVKGTIPENLSEGVTNTPETGTATKEQTLPEKPFVSTVVQPSFPGGPEALALFFSRTLSSPTDLEEGEKKVILVRFEVGADGSITRTEITQSGGDTYDREVLRAFKRMPRWNPAIQNGIKVATSFTQPVTFIGAQQ